MKTLIAIISVFFVTIACQKKIEVPPITPTPAVEIVDQQKPVQDTTTISDTEKLKEVECQD